MYNPFIFAEVKIKCNLIGIYPDNGSGNSDRKYTCQIECVHEDSSGKEFKRYSGFVECNQFSEVKGINSLKETPVDALKQIENAISSFPTPVVLKKGIPIYPKTDAKYSTRVEGGERILSNGCHIIRFHWYQYLPDQYISILGKSYDDSKKSPARFMFQRGDCKLSKQQLECVKKTYDTVNYCFYEFTCKEKFSRQNVQTDAKVTNDGDDHKKIQAFCKCSDYAPGKEMHPLECLDDIQLSHKGATPEQELIYYINTKPYIDGFKTREFKDEKPQNKKKIFKTYKR